MQDPKWRLFKEPTESDLNISLGMAFLLSDSSILQRRLTPGLGQTTSRAFFWGWGVGVGQRDKQTVKALVPKIQLSP